MIFIRAFSYLPFRVLYFISDILYVLAYYIVGYRKQVVRDNLSKSFPEKTLSEIKKIEKQFYKNLADIAVESLKSLTITENELLKRVRIDDTLFNKNLENKKPLIVFTSHLCNWEWLLLANELTIKIPVHAGYKRLNNKFFDDMMLKVRSRFGATMHEKNHLLRDMIKLRNDFFILAIVADQRPVTGENKYWTTFMNQDAAFFNGIEKLARKLQISTMYIGMKRVKRGYYDVWFEDIELLPFTSEPYEITEKFIRYVERDIRQDPSAYLWSHKRWKLKRNAD